MARLTPSKAKPSEVDFRFQGYRSPAQASDDSDTASPVPPVTPQSATSQTPNVQSSQVQAKISTFSLNKSMEPPQDQTQTRRRSKMRFSFLMAADESPNCVKSSRRKGRPSLAVIEDLPDTITGPSRPTPSSPLKQSTVLVEESSIQPMATESRIPRPSSSLNAAKNTPDIIASQRSRESSSRLSCSEFFDAREEPSVIEQMEPIFEESELRDLRNPTTIKAERLQQSKAPRESFVRQELAKIEAEIAEEEEGDVSDDETVLGPEDWEDEEGQESIYYEEDDNLEPAKEGDLVILDTMSISRTRTQRKCTQATIIDIQRLKRKAISLVRYEESEDIYADLMERLQRMYRREEQLAVQEGRVEALLRKLARWLKDWLEKIEEGRVVTGEKARFVKHELEWAAWIEEASRKGVLHVKGKGCLCEREWRM